MASESAQRTTVSRMPSAAFGAGGLGIDQREQRGLVEHQRVHLLGPLQRGEQRHCGCNRSSFRIEIGSLLIRHNLGQCDPFLERSDPAQVRPLARIGEEVCGFRLDSQGVGDHKPARFEIILNE